MKNPETVNREPMLMSIHDLQAQGIPRNMAYQLLNRADMPVLTIGRRKFMVRDKFMNWMDQQSGGAVTGYASEA